MCWCLSIIECEKCTVKHWNYQSYCCYSQGLLLIKGRLPPLSLSVTSIRPQSCQCCVRLNLSCLPDDLISVNRIIVMYFGVMKLWCDALLWHWWHIQLSEANVAVVFFHASLNEWSAHCRPHDLWSKCHTHLNSFQAGVILYRLKEAGDLPWVADQKI